MQNTNEKFKNELKRRSYILALDVIKILDRIDYKDMSGQVISKQLLRSTTSIGANIVEAQAGSTKRDFTNFLNHALKSANESKFWLCLLRDSRKIENNTADRLLNETNELSKILGSCIRTIKGKRSF